MIEIFNKATQFSKIFEEDISVEEKRQNNLEGGST
jgi:hypothetical protein